MNEDGDGHDVEALKQEIEELKARLEVSEKRVLQAQKFAEQMSTRAQAFWDLLMAWKQDSGES